MNNKHVKQYIIQNISHIEDSLFLRQIYTLVKLYLERKDRKHTGRCPEKGKPAAKKKRHSRIRP